MASPSGIGFDDGIDRSVIESSPIEIRTNFRGSVPKTLDIEHHITFRTEH